MGILSEEKSHEAEAKIRAVHAEKGEAWIIAAMMDGSVGYYYPAFAQKQIRQYMKGDKESWAERTMAIYECDLEAEILHDITAFEYKTEEQRQHLIELATNYLEGSYEDQMYLSLMYPTSVH